MPFHNAHLLQLIINSTCKTYRQRSQRPSRCLLIATQRRYCLGQRLCLVSMVCLASVTPSLVAGGLTDGKHTIATRHSRWLRQYRSCGAQTPANQGCCSTLLVLQILNTFGSFDNSPLVSAYAGNMEHVCSGRNKDEVRPRLQPEVNKVVRWILENHLTLNTSKSEVAFITMNNAESAWCPSITLAGIKYDCKLTLNQCLCSFCYHMSCSNAQASHGR